MKRYFRNVATFMVAGALTVVLVPVVVAAAEYGYQSCSTAGYHRLWTPRPAEFTVAVPAGDHIAVLEIINANASTGAGFAEVNGVHIAVPTDVCGVTSGEFGVFTGPAALDLVVNPVGQISVWVRVRFIPVPPTTTTTTTEPPDTTTTTEPPDTTTTTEPPDTTTTTLPGSTTTTTEPELPPGGETTTTTTPPPTTTTVPPTTTTTLAPTTTTTAPPLDPGGEPAQDAACVPGGFTVGGEFIPFDEAPQWLFDRFPRCRSAFDEESG